MDLSKVSTHAIAINYEVSEEEITSYLTFAKQFHRWVHSSIQTVSGLPKKYHVVSGITDAFNQTYGLYNKIGIFDGEYGYHMRVLGDRVTTNLDEADCIIVSHPFSADGMCSHEKLKIADSYNVPIFVDCAFFGICYNIDFDFSKYNNIHSVCFSLSKSFGTGLYRVGLLYTIDPYPSAQYMDWMYPFLSSAKHHYGIINKHGPDEMAKKYKQQQLSICNSIGLKPSNTVIFGLDYSNRYDAFKRGNVNRVCITRCFSS